MNGRIRAMAGLPLAALLGLSTVGARADSYILVHGAFQAGSAWEAVVPHLEAAGHSVVAVDLPGRDASGAAAQAVSLRSYIDAVVAAVRGAEAPVHVVGHSFGGIAISGAAEAVPEGIATLVYVAAYVPADGESMEALAYSDTDNGFTERSFVIAPDYSHATILAEDRARLFAGDGDAAAVARLEASMIREPLGPIATPVTLSAAGFGSVTKAYVRTLQDRTVSPPLQDRMIARAGICRVADLETGHTPYLTAPEALAEAILAQTSD